MAFRLRKSINLGGGFRINISKSGVGYSWGVPGFRISNGADGRIRRSVGIPGTGIYWTEEIGRDRQNNSTTRRERNTPQRVPAPSFEERPDSERTDSQRQFDVPDADYSEKVIEEKPAAVDDVALALEKAVKSKGKQRITLHYDFDAEKAEEYERRVGAWQILAEGDKEWEVNGTDRNECFIEKKTPEYIDTNVDVISIRLKDKSLIILPDRIFVIEKKHVRTECYEDVEIDTSSIEIVELGAVPEDTKIVGTTWKHLNSNGTPNRKYENNPQVPICKYGVVNIRSQYGTNVVIQVSNYQKSEDFGLLIQ